MILLLGRPPGPGPERAWTARLLLLALSATLGSADESLDMGKMHRRRYAGKEGSVASHHRIMQGAERSVMKGIDGV